MTYTYVRCGEYNDHSDPYERSPARPHLCHNCQQYVSKVQRHQEWWLCLPCYRELYVG